MNKGLIFTFSFAIGAAAGSLVTWRLLKTKYEQLAREEIEEVRAFYANKYGECDNDISTESEEASEDESEKEATITEYYKIASKYSGDEEEKKGGDKSMSRFEPYIISPAEFGEIDGYNTETLIYYNDGVLADNDGNRIEDIESYIGYESLNHFGEYEQDSIHVRNDDTMTDYEVLLDEGNYEDLEGV